MARPKRKIVYFIYHREGKYSSKAKDLRFPIAFRNFERSRTFGSALRKANKMARSMGCQPSDFIIERRVANIRLCRVVVPCPWLDFNPSDFPESKLSPDFRDEFS